MHFKQLVHRELHDVKLSFCQEPKAVLGVGTQLCCLLEKQLIYILQSIPLTSLHPRVGVR